MEGKVGYPGEPPGGPYTLEDEGVRAALRAAVQNTYPTGSGSWRELMRLLGADVDALIQEANTRNKGSISVGNATERCRKCGDYRSPETEGGICWNHDTPDGYREPNGAHEWDEVIPRCATCDAPLTERSNEDDPESFYCSTGCSKASYLED